MSKIDFTLTIERLKQVLNYDPVTGKFTRLIPAGGAAVGSTPGAIDSKGYCQIKIDRRLYLAHRLAWFYVTGQWHPLCIDHIDGNPLNNAFENLRPASKAINAQNRRRASADSKTGFLGVTQKKYGFVAQIQTNGTMRSLGTHPTPELAYAAYLAAKRAFHPGNTL
jgi:hypothetical protein